MRNIVVTGGSRGIGLGIARKLAASGFQVVAVSRNSSTALEAAIADAEAVGVGRVHFRSCDLSDIGSLQDMARTLRGEFGSIYGIVNNVGVGTSGMLCNMREADIERLMRLNVVSPLVFTKHLLRSMLTARSGRVVNISSIVALTGYQGIAAYSASKAALIGFTRSLAREVGSLGVTVNAVLPGFIDTEMTHDMDAEARGKIIRRCALGRLPDVDDVANAVDYLVGDQARSITGTVMVVDAGSTA